VSTSSVPTRGQLERKLSQTIQALYNEHLGQQPSKVTCQLCDKNLTIILEDSITQPEQLLAEQGQDSLAKEVRSSLDEAIRPKLKTTIESVVEVEVTDMLCDATLETGRTGIVVILNAVPASREPAAKLKAKSKASNPF
jgi:uncharacterized protein YbcI